jgi:hypothetical protein
MSEISLTIARPCSGKTRPTSKAWVTKAVASKKPIDFSVKVMRAASLDLSITWVFDTETTRSLGVVACHIEMGHS